MLSAALYQTVYFLIVLSMTVLVMQRYAKVDFVEREDRPVFQNGIAWALILFLVLFIGLRPISGRYFVDMAGYAFTYKVLLLGKPFHFNWDTDNVIFDNLFALLGAQKIPIEYFFLLIACIYFVCMAVACRKLFPNDVLLSLLVYLGAFSTFSYGTNGLKAGAAASIFLVAIAYWENKWIAVPILLVSIGFHHSMIVPVVAFLIAYFYRNPHVFIGGWLLCLFLAAIHVTGFMTFFSGFADKQGASYLDTDVKNAVLYVSGFRPDFILYSAIPIFIGYYHIRRSEIESETYNFLWCVYTITNCVFLLCTYGTFINRIAYLSWLMLPFVLLYPVLYCKEEAFQLRNLSYVVYGHLGFTLFMFVFYYGL